MHHQISFSQNHSLLPPTPPHPPPHPHSSGRRLSHSTALCSRTGSSLPTGGVFSPSLQSCPCPWSLQHPSEVTYWEVEYESPSCYYGIMVRNKKKNDLIMPCYYPTPSLPSKVLGRYFKEQMQNGNQSITVCTLEQVWLTQVQSSD